jgi:predicted nucleic acid-binding protein
MRDPRGPSGLIDTGAILALIDQRDRWHAACVDAYGSLRLPLATSAAVLTELFHMVRQHEVSTAWSFIRSDAVNVLPIDDADLPALYELMRGYADRPMDFADATLVRLAEREALSTVFTIDHDDFETYRIAGKRKFRVVPGR